MSATQSPQSALLRGIAPFSSLPEGERDSLASHCREIEIAARDYLFHEGDEPQAAYYVASGRIVLLKSSRNGKELIVQLLPPGELFGLVAFLDQKPFPLTARAHNTSKVIAIPTAAVAPLMQKHPELTRSFAELVAQRMRETQELARALAHDRIETRIASVLLSLVPRLATVSDESEGASGKQNSLKISLGRQELADIVGTTIETASRVMKALEREKIVDLSHSGEVVVCDTKALQQLLESA